MASKLMLKPLGGGALVLMAAMAVMQCARVDKRMPPRTDPTPSPPVEVAPPSPPPAPPPSEVDLAMEAGRIALERGDARVAVDEYRRAAGMTLDEARLADIHYRLALIQADPNNADRNLDDSRAELMHVLASTSGSARVREARVIAALIDEAAQLHKESAELKKEIETLKADVAEMRSRLEEKEKELAGIKKVLLQNKSKP